jgi:hypothetical protein
MYKNEKTRRMIRKKIRFRRLKEGNVSFTFFKSNYTPAPSSVDVQRLRNIVPVQWLTSWVFAGGG